MAVKRLLAGGAASPIGDATASDLRIIRYLFHASLCLYHAGPPTTSLPRLHEGVVVVVAVGVVVDVVVVVVVVFVAWCCV